MKPFFAAATKGLTVAAVEPSGRYAYEAPRTDAVLDANGQIRNKKTKKTVSKRPGFDRQVVEGPCGIQ